MKPEIKSITIYVRDTHFDLFLQGKIDKVVWTLTKGDPDRSGYFAHKQVETQVSTDTYQQMVDAQREDVAQTKLPF